MQEQPIVHVLTREQFDTRVLDLTGNQKKVQQDIQDLLNVAVAYASDPACNDYTFGTKLFKAITRGVRSNKVKGSFELYAGATWDKDGADGGQFKKDRDANPDPHACGQASNAWWLFEGQTTAKPFDPVSFFKRPTKTIGTKGKDDLFDPKSPEQQNAVDDLIRAISNEGYDIHVPNINPIADASMPIPNVDELVEELLDKAA